MPPVKTRNLGSKSQPAATPQPAEPAEPADAPEVLQPMTRDENANVDIRRKNADVFAKLAKVTPVDTAPFERTIGPQVPWIGCRDERTKDPMLEPAGIRIGDFYLGGMLGLHALRPFRYHFVTATQYYAWMREDGTIGSAQKTAPDPHEDSDNKEHFVALVLAYHPAGALIPCVTNFRTTKSQICHAGKSAVDSTRAPGWDKTSDAARVAAGFPHPWGRVLLSAVCRPQNVKSGKMKGRLVQVARVSPQPTPAEYLQLLSKCAQDSAWLDQLNAAVDAYESRVEMMEAICRGEGVE